MMATIDVGVLLRIDIASWLDEDGLAFFVNGATVIFGVLRVVVVACSRNEKRDIVRRMHFQGKQRALMNLLSPSMSELFHLNELPAMMPRISLGTLSERTRNESPY